MNSTNDLHKTVFISYRREPSRYLALLIFKELQKLGYDVFWDVQSIGAGQFEPIILSEIGRRAHFILLLMNQTLDRCSENGDWLRREVEYAMSLGRKIIPIMVDGFNLKENSKYLTGELSKLSSYNGMPLSIDYFDAGIAKLCSQFLSSKNYGQIIEAKENQEQVKEFIQEAMNEPQPSQAQLEAERLLSRGYAKMNAGDANGAISDWDEAIRLNPNYEVAYSNRGAARGQKSDYIGALNDLDRAISINPNEPMFFKNRGVLKFMTKNFDEALDDFDIALQLEPNDQSIHLNRVGVYVEKGELDKALNEQNKLIEINPSDISLYLARGDIYRKMGDSQAALENIDIDIEVDALHVPELSIRGTIYLNLGDLNKALKDYNNAISLIDDIDNIASISMLYSNRGEVHFRLKKFSRAVKDFETARKYLPASKYAIPGMIVAYHAQGQIKRARRMWQELLKLEPRYGDMDWLQKELNWADALVEQARKLVAELPPDV